MITSKDVVLEREGVSHFHAELFIRQAPSGGFSLQQIDREDREGEREMKLCVH